MEKALKETNLQERFTEHDLRAKVVSDIGLEHATELLSHGSSQITERIYRRKTTIVSPTK